MKKSNVFKTVIGGREVSAEIGGYCSQSSGECLIRCGDTIVLVNVNISKTAKEGADYFPLSVDYEEKMYAIGKIPGGYKKREGRPSDKAILTSRLIDRPIRPLFPEGIYNDVSVIATALSVDMDIPPEVYAMIASSIALSISEIPFDGPTASVIIGYVDGKFIINPNTEEREKSKLHLVISGTKSAVMMVEAGAQEITEDVMLEAILFGHEEIKKIVTWIESIQKAVGKTKQDFDLLLPPESLIQEIKKVAEEKISYAFETTDRNERQKREENLENEIISMFASREEIKTNDIKTVLEQLKKNKVRQMISQTGRRPDGRKTSEIRPIWCEVGILPRVHGSAVFTRGQTQALTTATLGTISEVQKLESLDEDIFKRYMHHYNFPAYSVGEARPSRSPGRREIGHGALAERALEPVLPTEEAFPYAIRTVSEILSSNGSSSQASVCGSSLALMDAGVPIKAPVAGIAMGLIKISETQEAHILSDIQGVEDFYGDMDFKVAGTTEGITAIQMDIKIAGIDENILKQALEQARIGRNFILDEMNKTLSKSRENVSLHAPKIITFSIDPEKIRDVIGSGGKVINKIIEQTEVKIDIDDEGHIFIASIDFEKAQKAKKLIDDIVYEPKVGDEIVGEVVKIFDFGAMVSISTIKDGMIHISKLSKNRVEKVTDILQLGDQVKAVVIKIDERDRIDLRLIEKLNKK